MARLSKIPDIYVEEIMLLSAEGETSTSIAKHLFNTYDLDVCHDTVARRINKVKLQRQAATQLAYAEAAQKSACNELAIIDDIIYRFHNEIKDALEEGDRSGAKGLSDSLHRYITTHMEMAGLSNEKAETSIDEESALANVLKTVMNAKEKESN